MNEQQILARRRSAGFAAFFFSGVCAISSGVVVSLLQEQYGFAYGVTGTLLSLMNIGNLVAGFLSGVLPGMLGGMKRSVLLLSLGYLAGYGLMGFTGAVALLGLGFFLVGAAKGQVINTCTVLVGDSSPDRTRGMNIMHSCYACGALLCPFVIAAAGRRRPAGPGRRRPCSCWRCWGRLCGWPSPSPPWSRAAARPAAGSTGASCAASGSGS